MKEDSKYYMRLDVIRIIACVLVLLYHLEILKGGYLAVCTFFALSGYLVCMSSLNKEPFSIKKYYFNRIKKIYIPLIVVVFITVIITKFIPIIKWVNLKQETLSVIFGYNNFWQLSANLDYFTRNLNSPFTHLWYISILMQFDLIFPIIFAILRKIDKKARIKFSTTIALLIMLVTTGVFCYMSKTQDIMSVYYNTIARIFSIIFGIYIAIVHYEYKIKFPQVLRKNNTLIFAMYCLALIGLCVFVPNQSKNYALFMILTTFITTRLIKYSIANENSHHTSKFISLLSKPTYEIYLVQYPIIFFMKNISMNDIVKNIVIIVVAIVIASIIHALISSKLKNIILKTLRAFIIIAIIIAGTVIVIIEKDNTGEMKELENILNENAKIMEERNKAFLNQNNVENKTSTENDNNNQISNNISHSNNNVIINQNVINPKNEAKSNNMAVQTKKVDEKAIEEKVSNLKVVGIGDSVLLDAVNEFYKKFPKGYFDGKISRTLYKAKEVVKDLKSKGKLTDTLILCLATNGDYSNKINKDFMELVGDRQIYWINAVGADDPKFNEKFKKFAEDYPNIHIIEWEAEAKKHPEYFYSDGVHMKAGKGMKAYVEFIYQAICNDYIEKAKK